MTGEQESFVDVSTHSRPKAAAFVMTAAAAPCPVSTHSRPKAAARVRAIREASRKGFNTQPPEGGCRIQQFLKF